MVEQQTENTEDILSLMEEVINDTNDTIKDANDRTKTAKDTDANDRIKTTEETLSLVMNNLKDTNNHIKFLSNYRDWIRRFINKLVSKLGETEWYKVNDVIDDAEDNDADIGQYDCIKYLENILNGVKKFMLLFEMKDKSNTTFHSNGQRMKEAKAQLNDPFPDDLK
ncbi:hypothetical protein C1645_830786 [Glomus cerebriforme]|uniref:Uncharacterized protein n=1 Tax=Glomus cerebriforme TaxID=658196 RepID=A0A397SLD6_9GLOM|nr:hypothetical protein C1645_830786 [Glomus cerebriforme]